MRCDYCMTRKCHSCKNESICFYTCDHNFEFKRKYSRYIQYQCTKCDYKIKLRYDDICVECIRSCKGKFKSTFDERTGKAKLCSGFKGGNNER